jgi:hypothetical protein
VVLGVISAAPSAAAAAAAAVLALMDGYECRIAQQHVQAGSGYTVTHKREVAEAWLLTNAACHIAMWY